MGFVSLTESVDTTSPVGRMLLQVLGAFAEFERGMLQDRTRAGLQAARARGVRMGRPPKLTDLQRTELAAGVWSGRWTQAEAARLFGVHRSTVSRVLRSVAPR